MPDIRVGERRLAVAAGSNLLDALLAGGIAVPHSCRAGSCHACLVHCLQGEVEDTLPEALDPVRREAGWRLACQCRVLGDLVLQPFDPERDGLPARVVACHWLGDVLRLRLEPERPLRYRAGQHLLLWSDDGVARPIRWPACLTRTHGWSSTSTVALPARSATAPGAWRLARSCVWASCAAGRCATSRTGRSDRCC